MDHPDTKSIERLVVNINDQHKLARYALGESLVDAILKEEDKIHRVFPKLQQVIEAYNHAISTEESDTIKRLVTTLRDIEVDPNPPSYSYGVDATVLHHAILGILTLISDYKRRPVLDVQRNAFPYLALRVRIAIANAILTSLIQKYENLPVADKISDMDDRFGQDM